MEEVIRKLDDATAVRVLTAFVQPRLRAGGYETQLTPDVRQALQQELAGLAPTAGTASEADLARQALLVLADDPQNRAALTALIEGPAPESFGVVTTVVLITAALVALQTHVEFQRGKDGKVTLKVVKKPMKDALLKDLAGKLLGFFSRNPPESK
jgi:hypothetical protein